MRVLDKIAGSCAVLALHYVAGITEEEALRVCLDHKFAFNNRGMFDKEWKRAAIDFGLRLEKSVFPNISLKRFISENPNGRFLLSTHNHLFVLDNGKIIDPIWGKPGLSRVIVQADAIIE